MKISEIKEELQNLVMNFNGMEAANLAPHGKGTDVAYAWNLASQAIQELLYKIDENK